MENIRLTIWNEGVHEREDERVRKLYPDGMGGQLRKALHGRQGIASVRVCELDDGLEHGLTDAVLAETDVLTWWGHRAHDRVSDEVAANVQQHVLEGMGLIVLHSGHVSKPFMRLMGTSCMLKWREWQDVGERERLWVVDPAHPVADGLPEYFELPQTEMYGEHFDIPQPDHLVLVSWFEGGDVFRSGCAWHRGLGKVFYFRPGHETFPIYYDEYVQQVIYNAIRWAAPARRPVPVTRECKPEPLEPIGER